MANRKSYRLTSGDNLTINCESEVSDGILLDTKVTIEAGCLCWVSGEERDEFIAKMQEIIDKYRI